MSTIIWSLILIFIGVFLAGWLYHRWSQTSQTIVDNAAAVVNKAIDETKAVANTISTKV
jgi:hypothetical protein